MVIDGVVIRENEINADEPEILNYIAHIRKNGAKRGQLISLNIKKTDGEKVELDYCVKHTGFERIRRITGYLVGTTDRWNNAKRIEEKEREIWKNWEDESLEMYQNLAQKNPNSRLWPRLASNVETEIRNLKRMEKHSK